ncbi:PD-(D/E)XK nuclease family protein [Oceanimonas sp. NS1]|nr:PD-(D/E)XK nuclease family protein [Oceanimonas sp. NS1]
MHKPNLFNFATSELSQDALLCWLLSWSDPRQQANDNKLHQLGRTLLTALITEAGGTPTSINHVEVLRQYRRLDVLCRINDNLILMIEDKTGTQEHSNQLVRYRAAVEKIFQKPKFWEFITRPRSRVVFLV